MCESHVSNPQTVGKCCSLLNSLLPPSVALSLVRLDRSPGAQPGLPQPHASVGVCAGECARVCLPSAHRKSAQSVCQRGSAWNRRFLQTVSMPTPSPSQHTHTHIHIGNLFDSLSRTTKFCSLSPFLRVFIFVSRLPRPLQHKR